MTLRQFSSALVVSILIGSLTAAAAEPPKVDAKPPGAHPASPPPSAVGHPAAAAADAKPATPQSLDIANLRQAIVVVEQAKRPVSIGLVLAGDGRIVTALSPLGNGNVLSARYVSGADMRLRMAASNRGMNLALLAPEDNRFNKGLRASRLSADDPSAHTRWLRGNQANATALAAAGPLKRETLTGGDGVTLRDVFTLPFTPRPAEYGSVLIDGNGDVVALVTQACQPSPNGDCRAIPCAIPVSMVKEFLRNVPASAVVPPAWIGLQVVDAEPGSLKAVRISAVDPKGPVAALGFRAGKDNATADLLVAVDGVAVTSTHAFDELLRRRTSGERVRLLIYGGGKYREATAVLGREPQQRPSDTFDKRPKEVGY